MCGVADIGTGEKGLLDLVRPGVWMALASDALIYRPAHVHANLLGFVSMMIFGVAYHVLPRFVGHPLHNRRMAVVHWWVANIGLAVLTTAQIFGPRRAALAPALPALRAVHAGRDRSAQARGRSAGVARPRAAMRPRRNAECRVQHSAAWRERALRGSHRFAPACRIFGDARLRPPVAPLLPLPSARRRLSCRPNRPRFIHQTRRAAARSAITRKIQSA